MADVMNDRELFLNPDLWPRHPYLLVSRDKDGDSLVKEERAILWSWCGAVQFRLVVINPVRPPQVKGTFIGYEYDNVDAMIADGWKRTTKTL